MNKKIVFSLIAIIGIAFGIYKMGYFPQGQSNVAQASTEFDEQEPLYLALDPAFVVNFEHQGNLRYLQISLAIMYHDQDLLDRVTKKMPAIRNALILLLSNQEFSQLNTLVGKQSLREEMKNAIDELIIYDESTDSSGEIYITNFVMQ